MIMMGTCNKCKVTTVLVWCDPTSTYFHCGGCGDISKDRAEIYRLRDELRATQEQVKIALENCLL